MASIQTLPIELQLQILTYLDIFSILLLRSTSNHFCTLIPYPTPSDFVAFEQTSQGTKSNILYCNSCQRLPHQGKFDTVGGGHYPTRRNP